jgi:hypothetical protein
MEKIEDKFMLFVWIMLICFYIGAWVFLIWQYLTFGLPDNLLHWYYWSMIPILICYITWLFFVIRTPFDKGELVN